MSDREFCKACKHCGKPFANSDSEPTQAVCAYPVPYWALPPSIIPLDRPVTCPMFEAAALPTEVPALLALASSLAHDADLLMVRVDGLLDPITKGVCQSKDPVAIRLMADLMPAGFYRSELRTYALQLEANK